MSIAYVPKLTHQILFVDISNEKRMAWKILFIYLFIYLVFLSQISKRERIHG